MAGAEERAVLRIEGGEEPCRSTPVRGLFVDESPRCALSPEDEAELLRALDAGVTDAALRELVDRLLVKNGLQPHERFMVGPDPGTFPSSGKS